ncbi:MAG: aminoglycoside phosphotransferase family protein, partial [Pseudomonadota bacterium]
MEQDLTAAPPDAGLVRRLLAAQLPHLSVLPVMPQASGGTDNLLFRLGDDLVVRLPAQPCAEDQAAKEQLWLPRLAPGLPLAIPAVVAAGEPGEGYPWRWSVCRWMAGRDALATPPADGAHTGETLGRFLTALHAIDAGGGPAAGAQNNWRGAALFVLDRTCRRSIAGVSEIFDPVALTEIWDAALAAPGHAGRPVWIHGDLHPGNLLVEDGRLSAVIDFGLLGVGDPAADLMAAWTVVPAAGRQAFRAAIGADEPAWTRARGWTVYAGVVALAFYKD